MKPREERRNVLIQARMRIDGKWVDVRIHNISSRGLLVQSTASPPRGTYVEIFKARHTIVARVVWSKNQRFGIHTRERLDVGALMGEVAPPKADPAPSSERRSDPRRLTAAQVTQRLERSQRISSAVEFGAIVACGVIAAMITVSAVYETLSAPFEKVSGSLLKE
jgi:Flp pilus assembly pilin Flp